MIGQITAYLLLASSFSSLSHSKSSRRLVQPPPPSCELLVFCSFRQGPELTAIAMLTWLGNLYIQSPQGRAMLANPCPCNPGLRTSTSRPSSGGPLPSSHGTVSSTRVIFWSLIDHSTMSGHRVVCTTSGNYSLPPTSTAISQELEACSRLDLQVALLVEKGLAPSLIKEIVLFEVVQTGLYYYYY